MSRIFLAYTVFLTCLLGKAQIPDINDPALHPNLVNKTQVDSLNGKPIDFYLNNSQIDQYSKMLYLGKFAVSDDNLTLGILDSLDSDNSETRPFYFFVAHQILTTSDGALSEVLGFYTLDYLTSYPCEFFRWSTELNFEIRLWYYLSAYDMYFANNPGEVQKQTNSTIRALIQSCPEYETNAEFIINKMDEVLSQK